MNDSEGIPDSEGIELTRTAGSKAKLFNFFSSFIIFLFIIIFTQMSIRLIVDNISVLII